MLPSLSFSAIYTTAPPLTDQPLKLLVQALSLSFEYYDALPKAPLAAQECQCAGYAWHYHLLHKRAVFFLFARAGKRAHAIKHESDNRVAVAANKAGW
jgi:hypothetical protein